MTDTVWGVLFVLSGLAVTGVGWHIRRDPESASQRMQTGGASHFQPAWAVKSWGPGNMRARGLSMLVGGPAFVAFGVLVLTGVIDLG